MRFLQELLCLGWMWVAYFLGVTGIIRAHPAVHQGNGGSNTIGKVVPDQQADLVLIRVRQESKKAAAQDARQE